MIARSLLALGVYLCGNSEPDGNSNRLPIFSAQYHGAAWSAIPYLNNRLCDSQGIFAA